MKTGISMVYSLVWIAHFHTLNTICTSHSLSNPLNLEQFVSISKHNCGSECLLSALSLYDLVCRTFYMKQRLVNIYRLCSSHSSYFFYHGKGTQVQRNGRPQAFVLYLRAASSFQQHTQPHSLSICPSLKAPQQKL